MEENAAKKDLKNSRENLDGKQDKNDLITDADKPALKTILKKSLPHERSSRTFNRNSANYSSARLPQTLATKTVPTLDPYLRQKRLVSNSVFHKMESKSNADAAGPPGTVLMTRSTSNLEGRYLPSYSRSSSGGRLRAESRSPVRGESPLGYGPRSLSLPRPGSAASMTSRKSEIVDHEEYRAYVLQLLHATNRSERFQKLQNYYNMLDKAMNLDRNAATIEIHKLKSDDVVDFETWRRLRIREKAEDERDDLINNLRKAQKEREFHFRPKEVDEVRWRGDVRLRGRDKSVENLKGIFDTLTFEHYYDMERGNSKLHLSNTSLNSHQDDIMRIVKRRSSKSPTTLESRSITLPRKTSSDRQKEKGSTLTRLVSF